MKNNTLPDCHYFPKDSLNRIEKAYLKSKKQSEFKHQSFRLFSLDASDLQILENIETQNGIRPQNQIKKEHLETIIKQNESNASSIQKTLDEVEEIKNLQTRNYDYAS